MRNNFFSIAVFLLTVCTQTQAALTKLWDYRYGGSSSEYSRKLYETLDHGFLVCGGSYSDSSFDKTDSARAGSADFWIVKTDSAGNILWDKTYGGFAGENFTCAILLPDSGFLLGGSSWSNIGGEKSQINHDFSTATADFWIIKIDKFGNKIWDKSYGGIKNDNLISMVAAPNGSFLLAGVTMTNFNGDMTHTLYGFWDYWVVKIDSAGNKLWDNNYGGSDVDYLMTANITSDKGFVLGGRSGSPAGPSKTQNNINGSFDYWIVKIDSNGVQSWDKTIGGDGIEYMYTLNVLPNDNLLLGGVSYSNIGYDKSVANHANFGTDYWFIKTDNMGVKIWDQVFGGDGNEDEMDNVTTINGGFLITGTSYSNISGDKSENNVLNIEQPWVLAIDTLGNRIWDLTINSVTHIEFCHGFQVSDGCFVFLSQVDVDGGDITQVRSSYQDFWVAKFCMDNSLPTADYLSSSTAFCQNTCLDFTNMSTNAISYQWHFPGGTPSTSVQSDPQGICYYNSGTFDVTLVALNANGSDTLTLPHFLTVYPQVPFTPITQIGDTLFSVQGYAAYQWYSDTVLISGAANYYYVAQHNGNYSVIVTDSNGCFATAFMTNVIASSSEEHAINSIINVFYSPDKIIVDAYGLFTKESKFVISNSLGGIVYYKNIILRNGRNEININEKNFAPGIYIASIQNSKFVYYKKIFIE